MTGLSSSPNLPENPQDLVEALRREQALRLALQQKLSRFEELMANLPGMVYRYFPCLDSVDRFTFVNSGSNKLLEIEPETILENAGSFIELIHPDDLPSFIISVAHAAANFLPWHWEGRIITPSGQLKWIQGHANAQRTDEGEVWDGLLIDITERKQMEVALRQSETFNRQILESSNDCIKVLDLDGFLLYMNSGGQGLLGIKDITSFLNCCWLEFWQESDRQAVLEAINQAKAGEIGTFQGYYPTQTGVPKWWDVKITPIKGVDGQVERLLCISRDITERKQIEERLLRDALHDPLTGLANRSLLLNRIEQAIYRTQRAKEFLFAVLFLDLDQFKVINDSLGHSFGDHLLIAVARQLEIGLRLGDTVARLGGDEFVILLEDLDCVDEVIKVAQRIQQSFTYPFVIESQEIFITTSIGIALSSSYYSHPAQLLRDADLAMYHAKASGRNRYALFNPSMRHQVIRQFSLESDLRRAIERSELVVFYQPIMALSTHQLQGVEALVRWQHPQHGMVFPEEFISIAEETGMIIEIDRWVLRCACTQLRSWQQQFPSLGSFTVSVNLSGKLFSQPDFVEYIDEVLSQVGLEGNCLKLDIIESVLIEHPGLAATLIPQLQHREIRICLDGFGTGYSSLSYLYRFPINILKIDRSFVSHLEASNSLAFVRAIVAIAHELGIDLVAEGIETSAQAEFLQFLGCQYGQGYRFSPPLAPEVMTEKLHHELR